MRALARAAAARQPEGIQRPSLNSPTRGDPRWTTWRTFVPPSGASDGPLASPAGRSRNWERPTVRDCMPTTAERETDRLARLPRGLATVPVRPQVLPPEEPSSVLPRPVLPRPVLPRPALP